MRTRIAALFLMGTTFAACGGGAGSTTDAGDADGEAGACDPNCHWDCFGGTTCGGGNVYTLGGGARACCHYGDPWPGTGPICTHDSPSYVCATPACILPDARYAQCLSALRWPAGPPDLLRLYCPEGAPHAPGDPCATDEDCRPVADGGAPRLACDLTISQCASVARPAAPTGFGASCGLLPSDVPGVSSTYDLVVAGTTCALCQVILDSASGCLRQGCTMPCLLDEDCPDGTVCLCAESPYPLSQAYCAGATDRTTPDGRTTWLGCP